MSAQQETSLGAEHAQGNETAALKKEIACLRQQLRTALEMLQIMLDELQAAHAAASPHRPDEAAD